MRLQTSGFAFLTFLICLILAACKAHAANSYSLAASASNFQISEHGKCRKLSNSSARNYFVPTKTSGEWTAFLDNMPPGVTAANCCVTNYVLVPASASKGTAEFCIMKWEARTSGSTAVATSAGSPTNSVTRAQAISRCANIGAGYRIPSNDEWTAMMRDVESVNANWSGGARKVGCIFTGNYNANNNCGYDGAFLEAGEVNTKARYTFSNGQQIWHLNGNVSEWVSGSVSTASSAPPDDYRLGAKTVGTHPKISAADRAAWGPLYDDYGSGCGAGDDTLDDNCGVGYYRALNGNAFITRGGEANDNRWDGFLMESSAGDVSLTYVGYRCAYTP